jgi:hypothetical protein
VLERIKSKCVSATEAIVYIDVTARNALKKLSSTNAFKYLSVRNA